MSHVKIIYIFLRVSLPLIVILFPRHRAKIATMFDSPSNRANVAAP